MNRQRKNAIITGYSLILMALTAGFAVGYAFPIFYDKYKLELFQKLLSDNISLYKYMLGALIFIVILDIIVSWTLYQFFKEDNRKLSIILLTLRLGYTFIFGIAIYFLFTNLIQGIDNSTINNNYSSFERIWSLGLIIFGGHLFALGILMKLHKKIPKWLWILTIFAGCSYSIVHSLKIILPNSIEFTETLNNLLALPMALGEICLAIWLIVKGGKSNDKQNAYR
jgi:hypothetical protein